MPITVSEEAVQAKGFALAARMTEADSTLFSRDWWGGKLLHWAMADEATKVALFRFIDVLPSLKAPAEVIRHLQEYLGRPEVKIPGFLAWGLERLEPTGRLARVAADQVTKNVVEFARRFIAGETPEDAMPQLRALWDARRLATVDLLGEACLSEAEADDYQARYWELLTALHAAMATWPAQPSAPKGLGPPLNISVKPSSLAPYVAPAALEASVERLFARLVPLANEARRLGAFITLDMEQVHLKAITFALYQRLLEEPSLGGYDGFGLAVQAYLTETEEDLRRLIAWARTEGRRIAIRLVKGAYWDYETVAARLRGWPMPVYTDKAATDAAFERCVGLLVEHPETVRVAFATHNLRSLAYGLAAAEAAGLAPDAYEVQTLYGMGEPLKVALAAEGVALREYVPIGELVPGMAYLVRRLLENTANESILRRQFVEQESAEAILRPPQPSIPPSPPAQAAEDLDDPTTWRPFANEPPTDFTRPEARGAMAAALEAGEAAFGATFPLLIDGEPVETATPLVSFNPARADVVVGRTFAAGPAEADRAVAAAQAGLEAWGTRPTAERAASLRRTAAVLRERRFELAALAVHETSKPWAEADADLAEAIDFCEYYAREMVRLARPRRLGGLAGEENEYRYQPRGVAVVIAPWNFPVAIPAGMVAAALVAGNVVVLKPSERSPITAARLVESFHA
ncbi:MAG: proline dehydrogenase family protein, partial [Nitrospinota bacterium]